MKNCYPFLLLIFVLSSCGIYRQNVVNVPLIQQKGQLQLGVHHSFSGPEAQVCYAPVKNVALMANYYNNGSQTTTYVKDINYTIDKRYFGELGIGLYKKPKGPNGYLSEVFFLVGKGVNSHFWQGLDSLKTISTEFRQVSYNRFCVQADLGKSYRKTQFAISPRLFFINYYDISDPQTDRYAHLANNYLYFETALTMRFTLVRFLVLSAQTCITVPLTDFNERRYNYYYDFSPFNVSLGLIMNLALLKQEKKN